MKKQKKQNTNKGITLIALVITIIVMLILVAVTITMAVNGGLFEYASNAGTQTNAAIDAEQKFANLEPDMTVNQLIDKYTGWTEDEGMTGGGSEADEFTFSISGKTYKAEKNMTWRDWVNSDYNISDEFWIMNSIGISNSPRTATEMLMVVKYDLGGAAINIWCEPDDPIDSDLEYYVGSY